MATASFLPRSYFPRFFEGIFMNQKGEVSLLCVLLIFTCMSLVLLSALELKKNYALLERRTHLYLCVKEAKGELHHFMQFMGRTNWGIKNLNRASLIMIFIPGMQKAALDAQKIKKYLKYAQNIRLISYLKTLKDLKQKSCPLDPRMLKTPFKLGAEIFDRDSEGAAQLRENEWTYYFLAKPYLVNLTVKGTSYERVNPKIKYISEEKGAKLSSLLSSL